MMTQSAMRVPFAWVPMNVPIRCGRSKVLNGRQCPCALAKQACMTWLTHQHACASHVSGSGRSWILSLLHMTAPLLLYGCQKCPTARYFDVTFMCPPMHNAIDDQADIFCALTGCPDDSCAATQTGRRRPWHV